MILTALTALIVPMANVASNIVASFVACAIFKRVTTIIFYQSITNCLALPFLFFFGTPQMISWDVLPALLTISAVEVFYLIPYFVSLRRMDTSIIAALLSAGKVFLPFMAFVMIGETLEPIQYIGFLIVILANLALNLNMLGRKTKVDLSFWLMMGISVVLSFAAVLEKKVLFELDWVTLAFWMIIFSDMFTLTFLIPKASRQDIVSSFGKFTKNIKFFLSVEVLDRTASLTYIYILSMMPLLVSKAITSTQPLFALIFGVLLNLTGKVHLNEGTDKKGIVKKSICYVLIVVGIVLTIDTNGWETDLSEMGKKIESIESIDIPTLIAE